MFLLFKIEVDSSLFIKRGMRIMSQRLYNMVLIALFAALISVLAQVTIPLPVVPITGQTLAIGLTATILGKKYGSMAVGLYVLMGAIGLPVYAQMSGGAGAILGPTGGFIISFVPMAYIIGSYIERKGQTIVQAFIGNMIGTIVSLFIGTIWLKFVAELSWQAALFAGFVPFVIVGIVKSYLAAWMGMMLLKRLPTKSIRHQYSS